MASALVRTAPRTVCQVAIAVLVLSLSPSGAHAGIFNDLFGSPKRADLRLESLVLDKSQATAGETIKATIDISSWGNANAESTRLRLLGAPGSTSSMSEATQLLSVNLGTLQSKVRQSFVKTFPVPTSAVAGTYRIFATIDTSTRESNSGNNTKSTTLQIVAPVTSAQTSTQTAQASIQTSTQISTQTSAQASTQTSTQTSTQSSPQLPQGPVFYVATSGNDGNPGTEAAPFRTITKGSSVLTPGATLYIKNGTYGESLSDVIPGGTSWSAPVTVAAYPGHTVVVKPNPGAFYALYFGSAARHHIIVDGLILDGANVQYDAVKITGYGDNAANNIRLTNCEVRNAPGQGILISQSGARFNEIINCNIHHNGTSGYDHGVYITTSDNLVEKCRVYENKGYGLHIFNNGPGLANRNIFRKNTIYLSGLAAQQAGIALTSGDGNAAYNNVILESYRGITIDYGATNSLVYNNTLYNLSGDHGIGNGTDSSGAFIRNNLLYQASGIVNRGSGATIDHNLVGADPLFVAAGLGDFRLGIGSPAVDAGVGLSTVPDDLQGILRPQGGTYDIGAFERQP